MRQGTVQSLLGQLRDFRRRSAASRELVAMGSEAVGPLLDALEREAQEGARWAMLKCLGELRAVEAVPVIAPCLDQTHYQSVAHDALMMIVGEDLGPVPSEWLRWAEQHGRRAEAPAPPTPSTALDDTALMEQALREVKASFRQEGEGRYAVDVSLRGGSQRVGVVFGSHDHEGAAIVIVYADCGKGAPEHYETVLRHNLKMPYGAIALSDVGGEPHFMMFNTILREGLSPVELRKSILTVGQRADRTRRRLTN